MKRLQYLILIIFACLVSCQDSDNYKYLSDPVATFVSQYWPNSDIESYTHPSASTYIVIIKNGPRIVFNGQFSWTEIDGNGLPLPSVLLYDQLPSPLFRYLEETENKGSVFELQRTPRAYTVTLLDSTLTYDIATGELQGS